MIGYQGKVKQSSTVVSVGTDPVKILDDDDNRICAWVSQSPFSTGPVAICHSFADAANAGIPSEYQVYPYYIYDHFAAWAIIDRRSGFTGPYEIVVVTVHKAE